MPLGQSKASVRSAVLLGLTVALSLSAPTPSEAQSEDLLGQLRQDGVVVLWFRWTSEGVTWPTESGAPSRYYFHSQDGRALVLSADPPTDLSDDYDPARGQRTDYWPAIAGVPEYPIPRVGYVVSDSASNAPFILLAEGEGPLEEIDAVMDSLAPPVDPAAAGRYTPRVWRAALDGHTVVFFETARVTRLRNGICYGISGWLTETPTGSRLQLARSGDMGCGTSVFHPWALLRRRRGVFTFLDHTGYESYDPELWQLDPEYTWQPVTRQR